MISFTPLPLYHWERNLVPIKYEAGETTNNNNNNNNNNNIGA
jgi:hypothetical protein